MMTLAGVVSRWAKVPGEFGASPCEVVMYVTEG